MSESAHVFNHARTTASSTDNIHTAISAPSTLAEGSRRRQQAQQPRQLLSCTKCRERKVKVNNPRRSKILPNPRFRVAFTRQHGLTSHSAIVQNRAQRAALGAHPKNASSSQKVATMHQSNSRMRSASFVPKTFDSRSDYVPAKFLSRMMNLIQQPHQIRTRASDQPVQPRNVAQRGSDAFTDLSGQTASTLEVQG
jgi:hypothetical protein